MTSNDVLERISAIVAEVGVLPVGEVAPEKFFADDLDIDSLGMVEISATVEDSLGVSIPDEELAELATVGALVDYVSARAVTAAAG
ncbi:acyl carrier protein [Actinosynnema pretiosum subsp. pretiosum]|uniref:Acyl carrier protein n=2 Tax=Actinosynnema TaxID=40566 RepID=C6WQJ7_ACTMD|nr:acyl carrier protein [Actinosynnema mirum]ACU38687.1 phosphopantetheine-binding [Actinosynnema mirum DSM 43827]AXX32284.1 Acyl carrier protein [Actinosynnema pretiosum subsp. pretiosum]QUF03767.1 acyl carrier protein [Actinosynnema pretiosum subsp. pretiosum]